MPDITSFNNSDSTPDRISSARLPIVDISSYLCDGSSEIDRATTRRDLDAACRDFGFFYVVGHGLDPEYLKSLLQLGHRFFDLPQNVKESIHISKSMDGVRGWQKIGENVTYSKRDQQEAIDIYPEPEHPSSEQLEGSQLWPSEQDAPGFKAEMLQYAERMKVVGKAFMRVIGDVLGEQAIFSTLQEDNYWVLRVIGYPPLPKDFDTDQGISCGAHTDYGCLTFLHADDFPGALQVEAKDGSWIPADPVPGALVVNIGDIMDSLTSHEYKSTYHRVIHRGDKFRVSIPFFFEPPRDMTITPIPSMVPEGQDGLVKPFTYFEHLKSMIYRHFVPTDQALPDIPNANELTQRG